MKQLDFWQSVLKEERDFVNLLGQNALECVVSKLMTVLGAEAVCRSAEEFCESNHCPPEELNELLRQRWRRHHVGKVARREEAPGPFPFLLIRQCFSIYSLEIWSPKDPADALVEVPAIRELATEDLAGLAGIDGRPDPAPMCEEADFCVATGCMPAELEAWLRADWIEYDISEVLAGSANVGPNPIVLVKQYEDFFTPRLFSPAEHLHECSEEEYQDKQISELNSL